MKKELIIHEWPTEGGICYEVVEAMPESWEEDETYYKVSQTPIYIQDDSKAWVAISVAWLSIGWMVFSVSQCGWK